MAGLKIVVVLGFGLLTLSEGTCKAKTAADTLGEYRTSLSCPNAAPTACTCSGHNETKVSCAPAQKALWSATWTGAASDCIKVTPDGAPNWVKHDFHYPSNYANTCDQSGKEPGSYDCTKVTGQTHSFAVGAGYNSNWNTSTWCLSKFCWVNPCTCNKNDQKKSTWLNSYYSYSMCGAVDTYTPASCDATTESACIAQNQCKWESATLASGAVQTAMGSLFLFAFALV